MPRAARKRSDSGIYHIIMRGTNRQSIFEDEEDNEKFLQTLGQYKQKSGYEIYGYCLMGNHLHLLLRIGVEPIEQVMRRICGSYVYWYNYKYERVGNLFQDRFKSEAVEDDHYLLTVLRYIHQNPLKAGLADNCMQYKWSSYHEYLEKPRLIDIDYVLDSMHGDREKAIKQYNQYHLEANDARCLELEGRHRITDEEARKIISTTCKVKNAIDVQRLEMHLRNRCLKELKDAHGLSIRQIERLTGINRGVVLKA